MYSISEIKSIITPIAKCYGVERAYLFGSFARGDAQLNSDVDLRLDKGAIKGLSTLSAFHRELEEKLCLRVDLVTTGSLSRDFLESTKAKEVVLYEQ